LPTAKDEGEDYDYSSESEEESGEDDEDNEMNSDEEGSENDDDDESSEEEVKKKKGDKIAVKGKPKKFSKAIEKSRRAQGRFKATGNRKNKAWIMKKKDRMRRQGATVKTDSKYSGRRRSAKF
jgi:18S rRNA (guanine1575-N7)-methyltransferase